MVSFKNFFSRSSGWLAGIFLVGFISGVAGGLASSAFLFSDFSSRFLSFVPVQQIAGRASSLDRSETTQTSGSPDSAAEDKTVSSVQRVLPSVVSIAVTKELTNFYNQTGPDVFNFGPFEFYFPGMQPQQPKTQPQPKTQKQQVGGGTGFIVSSDGLIVTNRHVVIDESAEYSVILNDGKRHDARVLARDPFLDVAVLKIEAKNLSTVQFGDSDNLKIGQSVIAIGNSLGEYQNTVTRGIISGIGRRVEAGGVGIGSEIIESAIQTDAAINPGNSGGPLIDLSGRVIGINTAINQQGQLIGFAIPINEAKRIVESVKTYGRIVRPWLGVRYVLLNEEIAKENQLSVKEGALVVRGTKQTDLAVVPGGPADKAGIKENDIIISVDGVAINQERPLGNLVGRKNPGDKIKLKIRRGTEEKTVEVTLGEFPVETQK